MVREPLGHALGGMDIDSTGGLLSRIDELNEKLREGRHEGVCVFNKKEIDAHEKKVLVQRQTEREILS